MSTLTEDPHFEGKRCPKYYVHRGQDYSRRLTDGVNHRMMYTVVMWNKGKKRCREMNDDMIGS
jgi:hypothetical protein